MNFPLWKLQPGLCILRIEVLLDHPISNHCTGQEQQSFGMGKSNSHPESHSVERVQTSVHGPFTSFLPPLSTPTKHTFTLGRQRSDRPAQQEKNIHSNFYSSFMQMTLVKLERSGIWENSSNKSGHLIGVVKDRPLFTFIRRMYLQSYLTTPKGKLTYE